MNGRESGFVRPALCSCINCRGGIGRSKRATSVNIGRNNMGGRESSFAAVPLGQQQVDALLSGVEPQLEVIAADLTRLYQQRMPAYDQADQATIQQNTLNVLKLVVGQLKNSAQLWSTHGLADLVRAWAGQIPLDLVAHSIQLGARRTFAMVRDHAIAAGLSAAEISAVQDQMWEWATEASAVIHALQQERAISGATRRADFLRQLLAGALAPSALATEAPLHRIDSGHDYLVACTVWEDSTECSDLAAGLRVRGATSELPVVDAILDGRLVALLPQWPDGVTTRRTVGIGSAVPVTDAGASHRQATRALEVASQHGIGGVTELASLGPLPLLGASEDAGPLLDLRHLQPVRDHGQAGLEILATITAYLDHDCKVEETAAAIHVHRNTIRYRLGRFAELSGLDLDHTRDLVLAWWLINR